MDFEIPNYTLIKQLGQGTMAEVWLAEHKVNKRRAAIKVMKPSVLSDSDTEALFLREGEVLASFRDDNIVAIYDNNRIGNLAYIVMEFLSGGTLLERMQRGPISVGEAIGLAVQIAKALGAAHKLNVIHRDLKPANIMLRNETTPVLTDFGAARMLARSTIYGKDGSIVGTPIYMSPEQITGQPLNGSSDLYALGVLFYELLTGELPYPGGSVNEIASQHLFAPIPKLPGNLAMLQPVLERLLAKKSEDRYATAQEFIDSLRNCYINEQALRLQVGYAATGAAWSSQLRALGFVLDTQQKTEIRIAQGEFLKEVEQDKTAGMAAGPKLPKRGRWMLAASVLVLAVGLYAIWPKPSDISAAKKDDTVRSQEDALITKTVRELRTAFRAVSHKRKPPIDANEFDHVNRLIGVLDQIDPLNGHALYFAGEVKLWSGQREPAHKDFYKYLEVQASLPEAAKGGSTGSEICYERPNGYCLQRSGWINHLLANDFYQEALLQKDLDLKLFRFQKALEHAVTAKRNFPPIGFEQLIPTVVLESRLRKEIDAMEKLSSKVSRSDQYTYQGRQITLAPTMIFDLTGKIETAGITGLSQFDPNFGVNIELKPRQKLALQQFSERNASKEVGLSYKGRLVSVAVMHGPISDGNIAISAGGNSTPEAMMKLAAELSEN